MTYCEPSGARRAVASLNGMALLGRTLKANLANPSRKELRALVGMSGKRKKSLEETRREQEEAAKRTREAGPSKQQTIRALEDKLKSMREAENFKLAIPEGKKASNSASGSSGSGSVHKS